MKKKTFAAFALTSCIALSATFAGCSLVSTNNRLDMEQVIATVDITKSENFDKELKDYKSAVTSKQIVKRELISYFLNVGYSYVQNGSTYEQTFNMLLDALVDNAVLVQYATVDLLKDASAAAVTKFYNATDEVGKYEALLDEDEINLANYKLYSSINSAIDNFEKSVIDDENSYTGSGTRSTPVNVNTEQDDYYPYRTENNKKVLDYGVYTGYTRYELKDSGTYQDDALEGTTRATRVKAYNSFLNNLRRNNLVDGKAEKDKLTDILALDYIKVEYITQLESRIINKYYDKYEENQESLLTETNYKYIDSVYNEVLAAQKENYDKNVSAFDSAMSSMSSTSFVLYSPSTENSDWYTDEEYGPEFAKFGFIYNILLPFNSRQSVQLNALKSIQSDDGDDNYYFEGRNKLLKAIETEDQRSAWFNGETDYSFEPEAGVDYFNGGQDYRKYLFFEGNFTDSSEDGRYKKLQAYDGRYSYNGKVVKNEDESYTLVANKLSIDGMLSEFEKYVNYALGGSGNVEFYNGYTAGVQNEDYYKVDPVIGFYKTDKEGNKTDEIDYSKFIYAEGKVNIGTFNSKNLMLPDSPQYKAMSAVNELQFAYTTDTSVLSNYIGYTLSAYDTSYIKEFEYAAKKAVGNGVGSFAVCAGDYGWHLIYVTNVFEAGATYQPDWSNIKVEGSFENLFFEWIKSNDMSDVTTTRRTKILFDYNKDTTVTKYQSRYQDLLDLGN